MAKVPCFVDGFKGFRVGQIRRYRPAIGNHDVFQFDGVLQGAAFVQSNFHRRPFYRTRIKSQKFLAGKV